MDENFNLMKMEEEVYDKIPSLSHVSYRTLHSFDDYTLLMQTKPIDKKHSAVQFIIWDKSDNKKEITSNIQYSSMSEQIYYKQMVYKISPTRYYIFSYDGDMTNTLVEMTVKP